MAFCAETPAGVAGTLAEDYLPQLRPIIQNALKQSPQMLQQNIYLAQSAANRYASDSVFWPSLIASAGYGLSGGRTTSDPPSSSKSSGANYTISASQALYQWGANKAQSDIGKIAQQMTERQYAQAYVGLVGSLRSQFLGLITKKVWLRNNRHQITLLETNLASQEEQLKDGSLSEGDLTTTRLNLQEAHLNLDKSVQDYENAKLVFQRLAGLDHLADESVPEEIVRPAYAADLAQSLLNGFLGGGVKDTLQAQQLALTLRQNELSYHIAKVSQFYPKFSIGGAYQLANSTVFLQTGPVSSAGITYSFGINAYAPIFNGFTTRGAKLGALAAKRLTEQQQRNYFDTTTDAAQNARKQLEFTSRALDVAEIRRALAQDAVRKGTEQFNEGSSSKSAVDTAQAAFSYADYWANVMRAEYLNHWSDFVALVSADPALNAIPARYFTLPHGK